jgi:cytidylate kinase
MKPTDTFDQMLAAIRSGIYLQQQRAAAEARNAPPQPFVTISRQAGAGGRTLARALAERLNATDPVDRPWTVWDRELVEKVAREEHIPVSLVETLETEGPRRSAFAEFLASLSAKNDPAADLDEYQVYRRVAHAARAIARAGRAILVGRGGVYATHDLPGGVHVRLVG